MMGLGTGQQTLTQGSGPSSTFIVDPTTQPHCHHRIHLRCQRQSDRLRQWRWAGLGHEYEFYVGMPVGMNLTSRAALVFPLAATFALVFALVNGAVVLRYR